MIKLNHVYKEYPIGGEIFAALSDVSLEIYKGEFTSISGPSGSGKSTLMHIMGLLDHPTRGQVTVNGQDIKQYNDNQLSQLRNEFVGFVFQQFNLINKLTVLENIILPAIYTHQKLKFNPKSRALEVIRQLDLERIKDSFPNKISGGQLQRVAIGRALMMNPEIILADEPTGNLDTKTGESILDLLANLNSQHKTTVIIITHDSNIAKRTKRKIRIIDGKIISQSK